MYSANEFSRCLKMVTGLTEAERKEVFSTISYPSDSYLMGELLTLIPADTFVEAVKQYESTNKKVTWVDINDEVPSDTYNHFITLWLKNFDSEESCLQVHTGWYEPWDDESGTWHLSDGYEYDHRSNEIDLSFSSHVIAWSREIPEYGIKPFKP